MILLNSILIHRENRRTDVTSATDSPRVLIVDDKESVAKTYELRLSGRYDVEVALGGEEALRVVDRDADVVLLDRRMPNISGDEVLEEIRKRGLDCRVVMLTAVDPNFGIAEMEFDDYVVKPVDEDELSAAVERALAISEYNDQVQKLSSLKLKRNVLEVEFMGRDLEGNEKYRQLEAEIEALESEIKETEGSLEIEQVELYL